MTDTITKLLNHGDVVTDDPATRAAIDSIAGYYGLPLPESLTALWRASAGLKIDQLETDLLSPAEVQAFLTDAPCGGDWLKRGFLPVLYDRQSNYLSIIAKDPLAFRVAFLPHDDGGRLVFRDFDSCLTNLLRVLNEDGDSEELFGGAIGDYADDSARSEEDHDVARKLLDTPNDHGEWNYAVQLLDENNLPEWTRLLETDHFVRRDVRARMKKMRSPGIRQLLQNDQQAFEDFTALVAESVRKAGFSVGERRGEVLQVNGKWMDLEGFFHRRNIPNAIPRMIDWLEDQRQGRDPHHRPGHFMAD